MRILIWHVHGSWTTSFVAGSPEYLLPVTDDRGPDGRGRAQTWTWPEAAREVRLDDLADEPVDCVVLQRPHEAELCGRWLGRRPGHDVPAVYLEHNAPTDGAVTTRHPVVENSRLHGIPLVHVTHFNALAWDSGDAATTVIEHGIADPGYRYSGDETSLAAVVNEPVRRWRVAGTDVLLHLARHGPVHVYGMGMAELGRAATAHGVPGLEASLHENLPQAALHTALPHHRAYLHPYRWTSLGLSLIEAMVLGLPVLAVAATAAPSAVPTAAGVVTCDLRELRETAERWRQDPTEARERGLAGRQHALEHFGLPRFLDDWDALLKEVVT